METLDIEDVLVEKNLRFKLKDGGSYVRSKESKNFYPSSVSTYTADTNSVIRFNITGPPNQWLSLPSLLLGFTLNNTDNSASNELRPIDTAGFFDRVRVLMGDVIVCDLNSLSRASSMKDVLKSSEEKRIDEALGFGNTLLNHDGRFLTCDASATSTTQSVVRNVTNNNFRGIKGGKGANVYFDLNLKCFKTCENWIPLSYCPITVELYLTSDVLKPIVTRTGLFTASNTSITWSVTKPLFKGNVYTIDDSLYAEYAKILETGSLPITFETETMQEQTASAETEVFTTIVRNVSKLNKLFISFSNPSAKTYVGGYGELLKEYNRMYHPLGNITNDVGIYNPEYDLSASLVVGNQVIPSQEIQGVREAYAHLMHCSDKPILVRAEDYRSHAFMYGFNLQKLESANYTGMNLKNNSNMVIKIKALDGSTLYSEKKMAERMYMLLVHECILEIRSNSVTFYD